MVTAHISDLIDSIAASVWTWVDVDYDSPEQLASDIQKLIFQTQLEVSVIEDAHLLSWNRSLSIAPGAFLTCEIEQIADGPQAFTVFYSDDEDAYQPIREWWELPQQRASEPN